MYFDIKKQNCFCTKHYFKLFMYFLIFILILLKKNYVVGMDQQNIASTSQRTPNRVFAKKFLRLNTSSTKGQKLNNLNHQLSPTCSLYDILNNIKLDLSLPQHLNTNSLEELNENFSKITINFYLAFDFVMKSKDPLEQDRTVKTIFHQQKYDLFSCDIPLENFIQVTEQNVIKLKKDKNIIYSYIYDSNNPDDTNPSRISADNVFELVVDIEINKSHNSQSMPINFYFRTYSFTSMDTNINVLSFDNVLFCLEHIFFTRK
ncbi:hypothetical protein [Candidatus Phytoplasma oryzae]|nr:hypothetical protein PIE28_00990 [Candidatus Phytoplasma oryzae]